MRYVIKYKDIIDMYDNVLIQEKELTEKLDAIYGEMQAFINNTSFSGNAVSKIRTYFNSVHMPVISALKEMYNALPSYTIRFLGDLLDKESDTDAVIIEEFLVELSTKLEEIEDFMLGIGVKVNCEIDNVSRLVQVDKISAQAFMTPTFTYRKEHVDKFNQDIKTADQDYKNNSLGNLKALIDTVASIIGKIVQSGQINILYDDYTNIITTEDKCDLALYTNKVKNDVNVMYDEYLRRLMDAPDEYDISDKITLKDVLELLNKSSLSVKEIASISADLAELCFWLFEYLGEKYIYKWDDSTIEEWLYNYIPEHISDASLNYVMTIISTRLDRETINNHLEHNRDKWIRYIRDGYIFEDGYIDMQDLLYDMFYGVNGGPIAASENTCEIIAIYNAMYYINNGVDSSKHDFPEIIAQIEGKGPCLNGIFGTSPLIMKEYLKNEGFDVNMLEGSDARKSETIQSLQDNYDSYIVTLYNDKNDISACIHTMCITKVEVNGKIQYMLRNDYEDQTKPYDSIEACLKAYKGGNSQTISIIGVRK